MRYFKIATLFVFVMVGIFCGQAAIGDTYDIDLGGGAYGNWPTQWNAISGAADPNDGADTILDFVGDANDACASWAKNASYVFFKFRIQKGDATPADFRDSHFVIIDVVDKTFDTGTQQLVDGDDHKADYGFAWDSKSNDVSAHGLEMMVRDVAASDWDTTRMDDIDHNAGSKLVNDINGNGRTTDGYLRFTNGLSTANFGTTTELEFAVSWSYLETYTDMTEAQFDNQLWRVTLGSLANSTDHNPFTGDIAGGANPASLSTEGFATVPEPASLALVVGGSVMLLFKRRRRS